MRDLGRQDGPDRAGEPAPGQGVTGRDHEAEQDRAERYRRGHHVAADQEQVAPAPPRRQQPEGGDEL